jgi:hypothetical protein
VTGPTPPAQTPASSPEPEPLLPAELVQAAAAAEREWWLETYGAAPTDSDPRRLEAVITAALRWLHESRTEVP